MLYFVANNNYILLFKENRLQVTARRELFKDSNDEEAGEKLKKVKHE